MTDRNRFERATLAAVQEVVAAALATSAERGVSVSELEMARIGTGYAYESELRL